jgi:hypothetical protein
VSDRDEPREFRGVAWRYYNSGRCWRGEHYTILVWPYDGQFSWGVYSRDESALFESGRRIAEEDAIQAAEEAVAAFYKETT